MLKGKEAVIGGTVENLADSKLESVVVELELTRRGASKTEMRIAQLTPQHLAPGERGRYSLTVVTHDWSGARVVRLRSPSRDSSIIFKSLEGAHRPLEPPPDPQAKVSGRDSRPPPRGEEFINTPENPDAIR